MKITPRRLAINDRSIHDKDQLIRLLLIDGHVVVDPSKSKPGRGVYILDDLVSFNNKVIKNRLLNKAFHMEVSDDDLMEISKYLGRKNNER